MKKAPVIWLVLQIGIPILLAALGGFTGYSKSPMAAVFLAIVFGGTSWGIITLIRIWAEKSGTMGFSEQRKFMDISQPMSVRQSQPPTASHTSGHAIATARPSTPNEKRKTPLVRSKTGVFAPIVIDKEVQEPQSLSSPPKEPTLSRPATPAPTNDPVQEEDGISKVKNTDDLLKLLKYGGDDAQEEMPPTQETSSPETTSNSDFQPIQGMQWGGSMSTATPSPSSKPPPPSPKSSSFTVHPTQDEQGFSADDMLSDEISDPDATMMVPDAMKPQAPYSSTPDYSLELPLSETGELDPSELTTIGNSNTLPPHLMEMEDDPDALDAFIEDELDWEPTQIFGPDSDFVSPNYAPASSEVQVNTPPQKKTKHPTQAYAPPRASFPKTSSEASSLHHSEHSDSGVSVSSPSAAPRSDAGYEDPLLHSVINEYRLVERLGVGSFASVYRVEHTRIDKSFAMKILHPHVASQEKLVKRFYREVRSLSTLHHPNIVQINDFDHVPQYGFYLIMEWIRGVSLTRYVRQRTRLSPKETLHLYGQLLSALSYAHDLGISHRDLKPGNIMIIEETNAFTGEVNAKLKILDFSLANFEDEEESLTMTGAIIGSPKYMSPEQAKGITTEVDYRSDLYSCGIILGKCLTGRDIFSGESPTQILMQHITSPPPALNSLFPDGQFPQELEQVYQYSLSKEKEERYQSASEFFQDLKSALALCL